jgi:hypothetical protein
MAEACERADEWAREGDWDTSTGTVYVDVWVLEDGEGGEEDRVTVAIHQDEPGCTAGGDHDWRSPHWLVGGIESNPGVQGSGGGVLITEACLRCGCRRTTDTWAQRRDTGEQGLTEVTYQPGHYDLPGWDREIDADDIATAAAAGACASAVAWLEAESRTVGDLYAYSPAWYDWAMQRLLTSAREAA